MPVTEVAILPLLPGVDVNHHSVRDKLRYTQQVMENALGVPGRRFVYYQGLTDTGSSTKNELYLLGDWQSAAEHRDEFLPSPANQAQLARVADLFDLARVDLFHVDVPASQVPTDADADVLTIGRHRVRVRAGGEDKAAFEVRFVKECRELGRHGGRDFGDKPPVGGWRIEKDAAATTTTTNAVPGKENAEEEEEWVAFCGWESAEERIKFASTKWFGWKAVKLGRRIAL